MKSPAQDFLISDADFKTVCDVVYKHCGISLNDEKKALVRARITKQLRTSGYRSAKEYLEAALANRSSDMFSEFIDAISTNLTSFFREADHFTYLSNTFLPALLAEKKRKGDMRLLAWCAACSSGEEPYTIGMTILDTIARLHLDNLKWDIRLLATDISTRMVAEAQRGIYLEKHLLKVPARCGQSISFHRLKAVNTPRFRSRLSCGS